jgi:hypothetical protein
MFEWKETQAATLGFTTTALSWSKTRVNFEEHSPHNQKCERLCEDAAGSFGACGRTSNWYSRPSFSNLRGTAQSGFAQWEVIKQAF